MMIPCFWGNSESLSGERILRVLIYCSRLGPFSLPDLLYLFCHIGLVNVLILDYVPLRNYVVIICKDNEKIILIQE